MLCPLKERALRDYSFHLMTGQGVGLRRTNFQKRSSAIAAYFLILSRGTKILGHEGGS